MAVKLAFTPLSFVGWGAIENVPTIVKNYESKKILVITDKMLVDIGIVDQVLSTLKHLKVEIQIYTDILPEPPIEIGEKLVEFTKKNKFDLIIGIGGGSALDLAKLASVLARQEGIVREYLNLTGSKKLINEGIPKILIPTTSGTGSEVTNISVLSLEASKDVISDDRLLPNVAIVDPQLTLSLPPKITAATGIDALTHAIEAYISVNSNEVTDALALKAIKLISKSLRTAVNDGKNIKARTDLSYGSYLAGIAFFNAGVGAVHALAYPLGGRFHIAHGDANAVLLPYVLDYIKTKCESEFNEILEYLGMDLQGKPLTYSSKLFLEHIKSIVEDVGIPTSLKSFNIHESDLTLLTEDAILQDRLLARTPMKLNKNDIYTIYKNAYSGKMNQ